MKTVLLVSPDESLRSRLLRALGDRSVFTASTDDEALKTIRVTEVEVVVKEASPPIREVPTFIGRVRSICANAVVINVMPAAETSPDYDSAAQAADFVLLQPFTARHLQDVLRQAEDKLRLLQEVAAFRSIRQPRISGDSNGENLLGIEASSHALTQMAKEFAKALAAGFDLPRVLDLFLDAVAEMARPSRSALLLADQAGRQYRVGAYRGLAPHVVEALTLPADSGLPLWLTVEGQAPTPPSHRRCRRGR